MTETSKQTDLFDLGYLAHKQHKFKKAWGQNFLRYQKDASSLLANIDLAKDTLVVEIGAGGGALTAALLKRHFRVLAFEIDPSLKDFLLERFQAELKTSQLKLLFQDALQLDWRKTFKDYEKIAVISNLPYASTRELILRIFQEIGDKLELLALMLQTEATYRLLAASPKEANYQAKLYGSQAVFSHLLFKKVACLQVAASAFYPKPKVKNSFVVLKRDKEQFAALNAVLLANKITLFDFFPYFAQFLQAAFSQRRKNLANNLAKLKLDINNLWQDLDLSPSARAEELEPLQLFNLAVAMYNRDNK